MDANARSRPAVQSAVGFNLSVIALACAALALGAAYLVDAAGRRSVENSYKTDATMVARTLGGRELTIPASWFRFEPSVAEGFAKQVELRLTVPLGAEGSVVPIDVTLLPRSRVRPSSSLLDGVYLHQFKFEQLSGPPGLVGKPLAPTEGYADETVWYDPLSAEPFAAKCSRPVADSTAEQCLRTVFLAPGIAAIYAFPETVLANWRDFDSVVNEQLTRIGAL